MQFNVKKAEAIAAERGLPRRIVSLWKHRGAIPDKDRPSREKTEITNLSDAQKVKNLFTALNCEKINMAALSELAAHGSKDFLKDLRREKIQCYRDDLLAYTKAINVLRIHAKKTIQAVEKYPEREATQEIVKDFLSRREIYEYVLLGRDRKLYNRYEGWLRGARRYPLEDTDTLKAYLLVFLIETTI